MEQAGLSFAPSSLCPRRREILLTDVQNVHKILSMTSLSDHPRDLQKPSVTHKVHPCLGTLSSILSVYGISSVSFNPAPLIQKPVPTCSSASIETKLCCSTAHCRLVQSGLGCLRVHCPASSALHSLKMLSSIISSPLLLSPDHTWRLNHSGPENTLHPKNDSPFPKSLICQRCWSIGREPLHIAACKV